MPGFFESLKRMAQGKPVFDTNDDKSGWVGKDGKPQATASGEPTPVPQPQPDVPFSGVVKGNSSTFPVVAVKRTRTQTSGGNMTVYCSIVNKSNGRIDVDEIHLAGHSQNLGDDLAPGQEREFLCYNGPRLSSDGYREATLNYKTEGGDYFQSIYDVEYQYLSDHTYAVEDLHLRLPIRDIYG
jgi:hypothetical protein